MTPSNFEGINSKFETKDTDYFFKLKLGFFNPEFFWVHFLSVTYTGSFQIDNC